MNTDLFAYSLSAALLGLALPSASAQSCVPTALEDTDAYLLEIFGSTCGDAEAGEYTGDGQTDIALVLDQGLAVYHSPGSVDYMISPDTEGRVLSALANVPGAGVGGIDQIAASTDLGLMIWTFDPNLGLLLPSLVTASTSAANATSLSAADVNGDGVFDLIAVDSVGNRVSLWTGQGGGQYSLFYTQDFQEPVVEALVADWVNSDGVVELLVVFERRLAVLGFGGSGELETQSFVGLAQEAVVLRETGGAGFSVAVLEDRGNATQWLTLWRPMGDSEAGINLGGLAITGLTASDGDGDGNEDPLVCATFVPWMVLFPSLATNHHATGAPSLDVNIAFATEYAAYGLDLSAHVSPPIAADFDNDGDMDSAVACGETGRVLMAPNGLSIAQSTLRPELTYWWSSLEDEDEDQILEHYVHVSVAIPQALPAGFTHLEVELRQVDDIDSTDRISIQIPAPGTSVCVRLATELTAEPSTAEYSIVARAVKRVSGIDAEVGTAAVGNISFGMGCGVPFPPEACPQGTGSREGTNSPAPLPAPVVPPRPTSNPVRGVPAPALTSPSRI